MPENTSPPYRAIADALRTDLLAGRWDRPDVPFPGARAVGEQYGVSMPTATRAIQMLAAEGLLITKPGQRPLVVHPDARATSWPLTGRYAKARAAQGLVFAGDVPGAMRKATISCGWVHPPAVIAHLLGVDLDGVQVLRRVSRTYVGERVVEDTQMFFPAAIVAAVPELETGERIQVVRMIEATGRVITRTVNQVRARLADADEVDALELDPSAVVFVHTHGTYGADGEPLEAVINVKPAGDLNVLTFETYEGE